MSPRQSNICFAYGNLSDYKQAIRYCEEALVIARQDNNSDMESLALYAIGSAYSGLGNLTDAAKFYEQSLAISRGVSDRRTESKTLKALADLYNSQSKYAKAIEVLQQSLAIAQDKTSPDLKEQGRVWLTLGAVYEKLGDRKQAIIYYQESLRVTKQIGEQLGKHSSDEALALLSLANIVDNTEQATNYRNQGLAIARENGNKDLELTFLYSLGKVDPEKFTLFFQDLGSRDDLAFGIRSQGLKCLRG